MADDARVADGTVVPSMVKIPIEIHDALIAHCEDKKTNKTVAINKILAKALHVPYAPSTQSARRKVPTGGGPRR